MCLFIEEILMTLLVVCAMEEEKKNRRHHHHSHHRAFRTKSVDRCNLARHYISSRLRITTEGSRSDINAFDPIHLIILDPIAVF